MRVKALVLGVVTLIPRRYIEYFTSFIGVPVQYVRFFSFLKSIVFVRTFCPMFVRYISGFGRIQSQRRHTTELNFPLGVNVVMHALENRQVTVENVVNLRFMGQRELFYDYGMSQVSPDVAKIIVVQSLLFLGDFLNYRYQGQEDREKFDADKIKFFLKVICNLGLYRGVRGDFGFIVCNSIIDGAIPFIKFIKGQSGGLWPIVFVVRSMTMGIVLFENSTVAKKVLMGIFCQSVICLNFWFGIELVIAVNWGNLGLVKYLLEAGINPNQADEGGKTALAYAVELGYSRFVEILLNYGANPNQGQEGDGITPLMVAALYDHPEGAKVLLADSRTDPEQVDKHGETALIKASRKGHPRVVEVVLEHDRNLVNSKSPYGHTLLAYAFGRGFRDIVEVFSEYCLKVPSCDVNEGNILQRAIAFKDEVRLKLVVEHPKFDLSRNLGVLTEEEMDLVLEISPQSVSELLKKYFYPRCCSKGSNYLEFDEVDIVVLKRLLDRDANPDESICIGDVPLLLFMVQVGSLEGVKLLLEFGADASYKDVLYGDVLEVAYKREHVEVVNLVKCYMSDLCEPYVCYKNDFYGEVLKVCVQEPNCDVNEADILQNALRSGDDSWLNEVIIHPKFDIQRHEHSLIAEELSLVHEKLGEIHNDVGGIELVVGG